LYRVQVHGAQSLDVHLVDRGGQKVIEEGSRGRKEVERRRVEDISRDEYGRS
jgi:hypothetical protein